MTGTRLALWITAGIALQLAVFLIHSFVRHWQHFLSIRQTIGHLKIEPATAAEPAAPASAAWQGLRNFRVRQKLVEDPAAQIASFYLEPEDGLPLPEFLPGQFLTFKLEIDGESITRCYSLSDSPWPNRYRVSIKRVPALAGTAFAAGRSSNYFHDHVHEGSVLQVRAPSGHFYLDHSNAPAVLIAGGIGITPMLSMLNWCAAHQPQREVWLFYGVRNLAEIMALDHLRALADAHPTFHLHLCLSNPNPSDNEGDALATLRTHHSRVDVALMRGLLPLKQLQFYLCGPTAMLQSLVPALEDWGVPDEHIHFEAFGPASIPRKNAKQPAEQLTTSGATEQAVLVTFAKSGKQATWAPGMGSLLEFAEQQGIAVDSGCRSGGCGTCQTTINAGAVRYLQTPDADPEPGTCLMCVSVPNAALTLDA